MSIVSWFRIGKHVVLNLYYLLTAPGTVLHEFAHYLVCRLVDIEVIEVVFFDPPTDLFAASGRLGWVSHRHVDEMAPKELVLISVAPLLVNLIGAVASLLVLRLWPSPLVAVGCLWLAFSFGVHAFPSGPDMEIAFSNVERTADLTRGFSRTILTIIEYLSSFGPFPGIIAVFLIISAIWQVDAIMLVVGAVIAFFVITEFVVTIYELARGEDISLLDGFGTNSSERQLAVAYHALSANDSSDRWSGDDGSHDKTSASKQSMGTQSKKIVQNALETLESPRPQFRAKAATTLLLFAEQHPNQLFADRHTIFERSEAEPSRLNRAILVAVEMHLAHAADTPSELIEERMDHWVTTLAITEDEGAKLIAMAIDDLTEVYNRSLLPFVVPLTARVALTEETDVKEIIAIVVVNLLTDVYQAAEGIAPIYVELLEETTEEQLLISGSLIVAFGKAYEGIDVVASLREHDDDAVADAATQSTNILRREYKKKLRDNDRLIPP